MKLKPRTTLRLQTMVTLVLFLLLLPASGLSQRSRPSKPTPTQPTNNAERTRLAQAATLLVETAEGARSFDDLYYRARIQMLAADALWAHDSRRARVILRRAWQAAAASDVAEREEAERELGTVSGVNPDFSEARHEVLRTTAARDTQLAEVFLRELVGDRNEKGAARQSPQHDIRRQLNSRRLALASELLEAGEIRNATEIATPLVNDGVNTELVSFILRLRGHSAQDADALYLRLLRRAAADPLTNANDVLILSTNIVSPNLMVVVDDFGVLKFRVLPQSGTKSTAPPAVPQNVRTAFYNLAAAVLTRPLPARQALTMQELMAQFYGTGRLLPHFENSAAPYAAYGPALRARHSQLFNEIEANQRSQASSQFDVSRLTQVGYVDPLRSQAELLAQADTPFERERISLSMVRIAVQNKYWDRARRAASEIENQERRRQALTYVQVHQIKDIMHAYEDQKEDDFESVATFVRNADVPPFAKAWGFAQAAVIAARKRDARRAQNISELLNQAELEADRVPPGTAQKIAAYGLLTTAASGLEPKRAWGFLHEFVKAANSVEDYSADEDAPLSLSAETDPPDEPAETLFVETDVFRLEGIFATMAGLNFDEAVMAARTLDGDVPQAIALIAVAKSRIQHLAGRDRKARQ